MLLHEQSLPVKKLWYIGYSNQERIVMRKMKLIEKIMPYWCPNCLSRFFTEKRFQKHYFPCEENRRLMIQRHEDAVYKKYNRKQRRKMGLR